jgi:hypothetical protein
VRCLDSSVVFVVDGTRADNRQSFACFGTDCENSITLDPVYLVISPRLSLTSLFQYVDMAHQLTTDRAAELAKP